MAKKYTQYYRLCQWEPEDKFMRAEFNQDNQRVEAALRGLETSKASQSTADGLAAALGQRCRVKAGYYVGDGAVGRLIEVGFPVQAVLVENPGGARHSSSNDGTIGGLATIQSSLSRGKTLVEVSGSGFKVSDWGYTDGSLNGEGRGYSYVAWG